MTTTPVPEPMKGSDPARLSNHETTPRQQERDWMVLGLFLALVAVMVTGFFALSGRIDGVSVRMDGIETAVNARFDGVNVRMDGIETTMNARFDAVNARLDAMSARFDAMDARFDELYKLILSLKQ